MSCQPSPPGDAKRLAHSLMPFGSGKYRHLSMAALLLALLTPGSAIAYFDPNAGGLLFQVLFPILAAIAGFGALIRDRIKRRWQTLRGLRSGAQSGSETRRDD